MYAQEQLYHIEKWLREKERCLYRTVEEAIFNMLRLNPY